MNQWIDILTYNQLGRIIRKDLFTKEEITQGFQEYARKENTIMISEAARDEDFTKQLYKAFNEFLEGLEWLK